MGRIDEALKRARQLTSDDESGRAEERPSPAAVPPADVFVAPWEFARTGTASDAAEPPTEPSQPHQIRPPRAEPPGPGPSRPESPRLARAEVPRPETLKRARPVETHRAKRTGAESRDSGALLHVNPRVVEKLVTSSHARPMSVEQYRKLASSLHHAQVERGVKVVMVVSALPGEGKTLTAANLSLTLSESYRRQVLLIDADLRRPTLHELFQVPNMLGLSDGLKAEAEVKLSLVPLSAHLSLLPAGRPDSDPMSGLISSRMRRVVSEAAARFDWVILDTPPVDVITDTHLLAAMVDTAVLVIQAGTTPYVSIQKAIEAIGRERILGVVLNRADEAIRFGRYKYYSHYDYHGKR